jgi:hypothetical protein
MLHTQYIRLGRISPTPRYVFSESDSRTAPTETITSEKDARWKNTWAAMFGMGSPVQVIFPDVEMNARIYTLDGDSGYKVTHKKVSRAALLADRATSMEVNTDRLAFPSKARRGEQHGRAKITKEKVLQIREWAAALILKGESPHWTIKSQEMQVSEGTLRDIVSRRTWQHVI